MSPTLSPRLFHPPAADAAHALSTHGKRNQRPRRHRADVEAAAVAESLPPEKVTIHRSPIRRTRLAPEQRRRHPSARRQLLEHLLARGPRLGRVRRVRRTFQPRAGRSPARLHSAQQRRRLRHPRNAEPRSGARPRPARGQEAGGLGICRARAGLRRLEDDRDEARTTSAPRFFVPEPGEEVVVNGTVEAISTVPRPGTVPYKDHILALHLTDLAVEGAPRTKRWKRSSISRACATTS